MLCYDFQQELREIRFNHKQKIAFSVDLSERNLLSVNVDVQKQTTMLSLKQGEESL